jgi:hypothetical protein
VGLPAYWSTKGKVDIDERGRDIHSGITCKDGDRDQLGVSRPNPSEENR